MSTEEQYRKYVNTSFVKSMEPVVYNHASGVHVTAADGRTYLDCFAGISVVNVGHRHPRVVEAAKAQLDAFIHCASYIYYAPPVGEFAEVLARITPGDLQKTFFCNSGAEAIEGAMRLAKAYNGKTEFIAMQMAFHGRTGATLSVTGNAARKARGAPYLPGVAFTPAPHPYRCRYCSGSCTLACADALEDTIRYSTSGDVSAFIAEPVMGEGGIIVPHPDYFRRVKEILDQYDILFIADEVQSGFGRCGSMFAIEQYGVEPDMIAMAKGIASGFPLGAFIAPARIADSFRPGEHLSTFGGNPVACAAGVATVAVIEDEGLVEQSHRLGEGTIALLRAMAERHPIIGNVRGKGMMIGIELVRDHGSKEPLPSAAVAVRSFCREHGVLVGVGGQDGNVVRIQPPLIIGEDDLSIMLEVLDRALGTVAAGV